MMIKKIGQNPKQKGAALLVLLLAVITVSAFYLSSKMNTRATNQLASDMQTLKSLATAKQALIGFVVQRFEESSGNLGFLPCPDAELGNPEGSADAGDCEVRDVSVIGRFPWRTVGVGPLRDSTGECLWYAVAGAYKNSAGAKTLMLNDDTLGAFDLYTVTAPHGGGAEVFIPVADEPENRFVAVIIAPGREVAAQDRATLNAAVCGGNYDVTNYLEDRGGYNNTNVLTAMENDTADTVDAFVGVAELTNTAHLEQGQLLTEFNDRVIGITQAEIWDALKRRNNIAPNSFLARMDDLTEKLANCAKTFAENTPDWPNRRILFWPAPMGLSGADYRVDESYDDEKDGL